MYDTYQVMVGESMFYRHQVYRQKVNGAEGITQELKESSSNDSPSRRKDVGIKQKYKN
jgi:hypothetical protein